MTPHTIERPDHARVHSLDLDSEGTFTDVVVGTDHGPIGVKVLSTPHDLTVCFRNAIAKAAEAVGLEVPELPASPSRRHVPSRE